MRETQNIKIIAQIGDTHSLNVEDMGKGRFMRFGASGTPSDVMQGTIQLDGIWPCIHTYEVLEMVGLTLVDPDDYEREGWAAKYFITGAIAYTGTFYAHNQEEHEVIGIQASVREAPSANHETDVDPEFDRQYPFRESKTDEDDRRYEKRGDNSVARELEEFLEDYAWQRGEITEFVPDNDAAHEAEALAED